MGKNCLSVLKGVFFAIIASLACVMIFALVLKWFNLADSSIKPVNQVIKVAAIFVGCLVAVKGERVLLKGGAVGFFASVSEYIVFGVISKSLKFSAVFFIDVLFGTLIGVIFSLIFNLFRRK